MDAKSYQLNVVSAEERLFSDQVQRIRVTGSEGELGIYPRHTPLLTTIKPGMVGIVKLNGEEELIYLSGGILEVQPYGVNILADTAIRAQDLDEEKEQQALKAAKDAVMENQDKASYAQAIADLDQVLAKIRVIQLLKNNRY